jgi:hypothetical protein
MFTNNMNLNTNKLPILVPSNSSSNSQHGSNQSLNIPEQQHTRNANNTSYNNESSLLMCGPNTNSPSNTHLIPNSGLTSAITTPSNPSYPSPLYANTASPLANAGADAHHNLQNLVAMSQVNNGGKFELYSI